LGGGGKFNGRVEGTLRDRGGSRTSKGKKIGEGDVRAFKGCPRENVKGSSKDLVAPLQDFFIKKKLQGKSGRESGFL